MTARDRDDSADIDPEFRGDALDHEADASVDDTYRLACPYCSEENELTIDLGGGEHQTYVEDCQVCCRPWQVRVGVDGHGRVEVTLESLDE